MPRNFPTTCFLDIFSFVVPLNDEDVSIVPTINTRKRKNEGDYNSIGKRAKEFKNFKKLAEVNSSWLSIIWSNILLLPRPGGKFENFLKINKNFRQNLSRSDGKRNLFRYDGKRIGESSKGLNFSIISGKK